MKKIYCISGLGADERAFGRLQIKDHHIVPLPWLMPIPNETIAQYAVRMSAVITEDNPILMGLSFGGMMSIEIAKIVNAEKVILISSIKSADELPAWLKLSGQFRLNRIFPMRSFKIMEPIQNIFLGAQGKDEKDMARSYRKNAPQQYTDWAINEVLHWQNTWQPSRLFHIHGDNDKMFPIKYVSPTHVVKGGGHFMIMNKAAEVSAAINEVIGR
jgi:pimeloyl-ACP methyl ester carboxylesterase